MATKVRYAWYSPTQKKYCKECGKFESNKKSYSSYIYLNTDGKEVEVTEVTSNPEFISYFKDAKRVGMVTKFVRHTYD